MSRDTLAFLKRINGILQAGATADAIQDLARTKGLPPSSLDALGQALRRSMDKSVWTQGFKGFKISLLASFQTGSMANLLVAEGAKIAYAMQIQETDYKQWLYEFTSAESSTRSSPADAVICLFDDSVVFDKLSYHPTLEEIRAAGAMFLQECQHGLQVFRQHSEAPVVLTSLLLSPRYLARFIGLKERQTLRAYWHEMNRQLYENAALHSNVVILDLDNEALEAEKVFCEERLRLFASQVFSLEFLSALSQTYRKILESSQGKSRKALILDLDHTLWGGVLGDDGMEGVKLGGLFPGNAYQEIQKFAKALEQQGVLLAVCSKNDEANVLRMLAEHPEQILRPTDFALIQANWQPKSENIKAIAEALNISREALVFLDDSPFEREEVRKAWPEVLVPEPQGLPENFLRTLLAEANFLSSAVTQEDRERTKLYRSESQRRLLLSGDGNYEEFLQQLQMELMVRRLSPTNVTRVVQLFQRTNQFNMSNHRYTEAELFAIEAEGGSVFLGELSDTFGSSGIIAAAVVKRLGKVAWLDNMVLSCRVFNRGVEKAFLAHIWQEIRQEPNTILRAIFIASPRNQRFRAFYSSQNFISSDDKVFEFDGSHDIKPDPWISFA